MKPLLPPTLFGRRMRTRMRAHGVTVWETRFGGLSCSIAHDPRNKRPYHVQVDAWTSRAVWTSDHASWIGATAKLEDLLSGITNRVPLHPLLLRHPEQSGRRL